MNINDLIRDNKTNHYKLLTIVGEDESKAQTLIAYLQENRWTAYDVEDVVFHLIRDLPEGDIRLSIGSLLKKWLKKVEDKIVLFNASILYSHEMDGIGPFDAFKYNMRGDKEGILFLEARLRGNMAIYSTPDRPDFQERELSDVLYVALENVSIAGE